MHAGLVGLVVVTLSASVCDAARILALVPYRGKSHWIVIEPLLLQLASRGHQMTVFTVFPQKRSTANYTEVDFSSKVQPFVGEITPAVIRNEMANPWVIPVHIFKLHKETCTFLKEPVFTELLQSHVHFDLAITEVFGSDCFTYVAYKLKIPLISITTSVPVPWSSDRMGLPDNPAYIPTYPVSLKPNMNLWERAYNTLCQQYSKYLYSYIYDKETHRIAEDYMGESLPPVHEVVANTSLLLVNSYYALSQSRPFPPNVVEVGGIHIKESQPLPKDLQDIFDKAKDGIIIVSFGSLVKASSLPKQTIQMFMNAFAKIPQTVVFKYEEALPGAPSNVILRDWLPQRDMLEHSNVRAVILHGGLSSTIEAVHCAKPVIGIPFFADQFSNIMAVEQKGAGILLDLDSLSEHIMLEAIGEIISNPKYTENMKQLSREFRDRPMTPLQTAVFWTEYVIRHKGAPHLRPTSVGMPLYQYLLLDVIAVLLSTLAIVLTAVYVILKFTLKILSRRINSLVLKIFVNVKKFE